MPDYPRLSHKVNTVTQPGFWQIKDGNKMWCWDVVTTTVDVFQRPKNLFPGADLWTNTKTDTVHNCKAGAAIMGEFVRLGEAPEASKLFFADCDASCFVKGDVYLLGNAGIEGYKKFTTAPNSRVYIDGLTLLKDAQLEILVDGPEAFI